MLDLDVAFAKMTNPRMSAGLMVIHTLLDRLQADPVKPSEVREAVDKLTTKRKVTKQAISNVAGRLVDSGLIERIDNKYSVRHGYLLSILLDTVITLNERVSDLEDEIEQLKSA